MTQATVGLLRVHIFANLIYIFLCFGSAINASRHNALFFVSKCFTTLGLIYIVHHVEHLLLKLDKTLC